MIDAGAGLFDTAPFYGASEQRLGAALRGVARDRFVVITKAGSRVTRAGIEKDFSPAGVIGSVEASLRSLRLDHVDLLLLHGPAADACTDDLAWALAQLQARGLVRAVGACVRDAGTMAAAAWAPVKVLQGPIWMTVAGAGWAAHAASRGQGFLAIEALRPSASGLRAPKSAADLWYLARAVTRWEAPADGVPAGERLAAALATSDVSAVIATTTRIAHLRANLAVAAAVVATA
jgi:aryl-alcohol dehydrogenase-like predicted oxidoreductase